MALLGEMFDPADYPDLLVGLNEPDDGAVYRLGSERALISTTDFFPPVVDDPYTFGAIAAANAMSDVYAMGGEVLYAINLVAWPDDLEPEYLSEILRGGAEMVRTAGAVIAGGHTISDQEPKYGLAVTGTVHPDRIITKGGARAGDALVLTKPLGSGVITTALKRMQADPPHVQACVAVMLRLNRNAMFVAQSLRPHVHAATDVTGFGLLGHAHEMAHLSGCTLQFEWHRLPWMEGALRYGEEGVFAGGVERNVDFYGRWVSFERNLTDWERWMPFDPQTSGGLLLAVEADHVQAYVDALARHGETAWVVGAAVAGEAGRIVVV